MEPRKESEKRPSDPPDLTANHDSFTLAIFPVSRYLGDAALQQAVVELADRGRSDIKPADARALLPFHPLGQEVLKEKPDMDVYCLLSVYGNLVRTHVVVANGVARTNPPPEGYVCDSCHARGWLKKEFQESKLDGANIPVWLCPDCSKLKPEERDVRF